MHSKVAFVMCFTLVANYDTWWSEPWWTHVIWRVCQVCDRSPEKAVDCVQIHWSRWQWYDELNFTLLHFLCLYDLCIFFKCESDVDWNWLSALDCPSRKCGCYWAQEGLWEDECSCDRQGSRPAVEKVDYSCKVEAVHPDAVRSWVPSVWFLCKNCDFVVIQEQKLGARGLQGTARAQTWRC